ncbi:MAG: SUMF1/EgtB/PvdO family nonheme iron enzyme [Thermoguttaceae bacterium]|nr:SUMF1/EgtB/PvdO family nonheme iron enzyme [Thermoguttaceae bacterium]
MKTKSVKARVAVWGAVALGGAAFATLPAETRSGIDADGQTLGAEPLDVASKPGTKTTAKIVLIDGELRFVRVAEDDETSRASGKKGVAAPVADDREIVFDEDLESVAAPVADDREIVFDEDLESVAAPVAVSRENSDVPWNAEPKAGTRKTLTLNGVECAFRYCPAGTFEMTGRTADEFFVKMMLDDDEDANDDAQRVAPNAVSLVESDEGASFVTRSDPVNDPTFRATISNGFWMMETETTQELWEATTGENPSCFSPTGDAADAVEGLDASRFPVENVNWDDCQKFAEKLNASGFAPDGFEFRLPTEAEWEFACRAGTTTDFFWGDSLNGDKANCCGSSPYGVAKPGPDLQRTTEVGSYDPNPWGLYDMHGNVSEWCADWFASYDASPKTDPTGPKSGKGRAARGGSWAGMAWTCKSTVRSAQTPETRGPNAGVRLVLARVANDAAKANDAASSDGEAKANERRAVGENGATPRVAVPVEAATSEEEAERDFEFIRRKEAARLVASTGVVTVDGAPVDGATVVFAPVALGGTAASATTDANGEYEATGLVPGDYKVAVSKSAPLDEDQAAFEAGEITYEELQERKTVGGRASRGESLVPEVFSSLATTPITVTIGERNNVFDFDLSF